MEDVTIERPAPGHIIVNTTNCRTVMTDQGRLVPPRSVHIHPGVPTRVLEEVIADRAKRPEPKPEPEPAPPAPVAKVPAKKAARKVTKKAARKVAKKAAAKKKGGSK